MMGSAFYVILLPLFFSSGVVWEAKKKRRYKAINNNQSKIIENAFQDYYTQLSIGNQPEPKPKNLPARVEVNTIISTILINKL